jgi:CheY-like chemotaxis protein
MSHKLLLVDDSVTIQRVVQLTFADEDVEVVTVGDGSQVFEAIWEEMPDIILVDVDMPHKNGYEVTAFVKSEPTRDIPVILLTGAFNPVNEGQAKQAGCDGVLVKPFEPKQVIEKVRELLDGRDVNESSPPVEPESTVSPEDALSPSGIPAQRHEVDSVLAKAFRDYLAEDQIAQSVVTSTSKSELDHPAPLVTDEMLETLRTQVVSKMTDSIVREITADVVAVVAERLVRAEIARMKFTVG